MKRIRVEDLRVPSPKERGGRRRIPSMKPGWMQSADSPGTYEDGRVRRNECESLEPLAGCLGRPRVGTAKAPPITCKPGKLWRAGEWGGWGRISDDGPGQHNPDRSEGPPRVERLTRSHGGVAAPVLHFDSERRPCVPQATRRPGANHGGALIDPLHLGRPRLIGRPWSRIGENPPYGILGGTMETSASCEARSAPSSYPTPRQ
jgi:hypothetical protein